MSDPKSFWNYIDSKQSSSNLPECHTLTAHSEASNPRNVCRLFASFFKSVYEPFDDAMIPDFAPVNSAGINFVQFSDDEILNAMKSLKVQRSGPDLIPSLLLKSCSEMLIFPLMVIFNQSLINGFFPSAWKLSHLQPIHKSGSKSKVENYRGISILSAAPKMFECLVNSFLTKNLTHFISPHQHGFVSGRSCASNLVTITSDIVQYMEKGFQIDVIFTDFKKAFDKVQINVLIKVLKSYGVDGSLLSWISSYLTHRH